LENWIHEENLRPFFEFAASRAEYDLCELDWDAITYGLRGTNYEADEWFEYPLIGRERLDIAAAADPGSSVVFVRIAGSTDIALETAVALMQDYVLKRS
jgi:hypothetical protein